MDALSCELWTHHSEPNDDKATGYLGLDVPQGALKFHALRGKEVRYSLPCGDTSVSDNEPQLPQELIYMHLPDDLLHASKLVKITEPPRITVGKTDEEPVVGWVIVMLSSIAVILSLYWTK